MSVRRMIFTVGPWAERFGDPRAPKRLIGLPVTRSLAVSDASHEALVALSDRRYALTGSTLAVGPATKMARHMRRRAAASASTSEAAWLRDGAEILDDLRANRAGRAPR